MLELYNVFIHTKTLFLALPVFFVGKLHLCNDNATVQLTGHAQM